MSPGFKSRGKGVAAGNKHGICSVNFTYIFGVWASYSKYFYLDVRSELPKGRKIRS